MKKRILIFWGLLMLCCALLYSAFFGLLVIPSTYVTPEYERQIIDADGKGIEGAIGFMVCGKYKATLSLGPTSTLVKQYYFYTFTDSNGYIHFPRHRFVYLRPAGLFGLGCISYPDFFVMTEVKSPNATEWSQVRKLPYLAGGDTCIEFIALKPNDADRFVALRSRKTQITDKLKY